ncbi:MAG: TatD family hydrolase [Bacteroidales bacterium]|nr:TatD family hydrolase [Bacteroidales bacterium]
MPWIDTHAHLQEHRFAADLPAVLARATEAGVERIITIGIDLPTSRSAVQLAAQYPLLASAVGIQPNHVSEAEPGDWDAIVTLAETDPTIVAIGETGLDRYWDRSPFPLQEEYFRRHLALARRLGKPVIIHCREAEADTVRVLRETIAADGPVAGVMHSFSGDAATAEQCVQLGLLISCAGMVTFPSNTALREIAAAVPADRLLIETDCPYLTPVPVRGQRNEPAFVAHTAKLLASVRGISPEELGHLTTANARRLFALSAN